MSAGDFLLIESDVVFSSCEVVSLAGTGPPAVLPASSACTRDFIFGNSIELTGT